MDMRRYLPIILIAFVALFILPQLLKGNKGGKALSAKDRGRLTLEAIGRVDQAEQKLFKAKGAYTASLSDLVSGDKILLAPTGCVEVDKEKSYYVSVEPRTGDLTRAASGVC